MHYTEERSMTYLLEMLAPVPCTGLIASRGSTVADVLTDVAGMVT